jgi:hypothetical protein
VSVVDGTKGMLKCALHKVSLEIWFVVASYDVIMIHLHLRNCHVNSQIAVVGKELCY